MKEVDLIIFDFDGTLVDTRVDIVNSVNFVLQKSGIPKRDFDVIVSYVGGGVDYLLRKAIGVEYRDKLREVRNLYTEYQKDHFLDKAVLYPHVKKIISAFKDKRLAIISNRHTHSLQSILKAFGLADFFEVIIGGDDVACLKPSPCPVLALINKTGANKERSIMVGDMDYDIKSGKEAGILTCAVTYGLGKKGDIEKAKPDFIIDDLWELKEIIR